jgi:hypothetical protein
MDWTIGVLGFDSQPELGIFLFTASRTALGPTQPPIRWVPGALSLGLKRPPRETDHSPSSSAEIKNAWSCTSTPPIIFMPWCLVKQGDNCTFTFTFPIWRNDYESWRMVASFKFIFLLLPGATEKWRQSYSLQVHGLGTSRIRIMTSTEPWKQTSCIDANQT